MGFHLTEQIEETATASSGVTSRRRSISGCTLRQKNRIGTQSCLVILSSKYWDDETGLIMFPKRPYSPVLGRFICKDPAQEKGGTMLYGYCLNNSLNRIDPLGEKAYVVYRPFNDWLLQLFYPLIGHVYLAFDNQFGGNSYGENLAADWQSVVQSSGVDYKKTITFSFHPKAVRADVLKDVPKNAGAKISTILTDGSFVDINGEVDIEGLYKSKSWFSRGRSHELTDDFCKQTFLFKKAVESARQNNAGSPDPGPYLLFSQNCGTWAKLITERGLLKFPDTESVFANGGAGVGGIPQETGVGSLLTFTAKSLYGLAELISDAFSSKDVPNPVQPQ